MARSKKIDFEFFNLKMEENDTVIILKARCNKEYLVKAINRVKGHENYGECYDIEILEDILSMDNIEYYIIEPTSVNF